MSCDRVIAVAGLVLLSPLLILVALLILVDDGPPVLFRQTRVGYHGHMFRLLKFRSMRRNTTGLRITYARDNRVTGVGRMLRRFKLDELPQLWNVVCGDMALLGPRPEVPDYVDLGDETWRMVLEVRPGITDLATLVYRNEEDILATCSDIEGTYRQTILPKKLALNLKYIAERSPMSDVRLLLLTLRYSVLPSGFDASAIEGAVLGRGVPHA